MKKIVLATACLVGMAFAQPQLSATELGAGQIEFCVELAGGQVVEMYVKKNNEAGYLWAGSSWSRTAVSGTDVTLCKTVTGFQDGDLAQYRVYSFAPAQPGVFTPGPASTDWEEFVTGTPSSSSSSTPSSSSQASPYVLDNTTANNCVSVTLTAASNQAQVEIFGRRINQAGNDYVKVFNVDVEEVEIGGGLSTYTTSCFQYANGETIQYRAYSYLPAQGGIYTPGATINDWKTCTVNGNTCN